jgi:3'-phosphoadenosine 5'-phosphosulfate sulfotransferase (PAPS reductase)/FAD synthetase
VSFDSGEAVDRMIERANEIVEAAKAEYRPIEIVSAFSGGNDSVVSTHYGAETHGTPALHCATTTGCQETTCHIRDLCSRRKWQLEERVAPVSGPPKKRPGRELKFDAAKLPAGKWTDGGTAYEEFVLNYAFPGPPQHVRMYQRLKGRSIEGFVRDTKRGHKRTATVMILSGIRHDESKVRAGYKRAVSKVGSQIWVNPFYYATGEDFEAYRQEFGLPRNPIKDKVGISGECCCGAYAGEQEIDRVLSASPTNGAYLLGLQERVRANGFPWAAWGVRPPDWYYQQQAGQLMFDFEDDAGAWQPMCVGCGKERKIGYAPARPL